MKTIMSAYKTNKNPNSSLEEINLDYIKILETFDHENVFFNNNFALQLQSKLNTNFHRKAITEEALKSHNDAYTLQLFKDLN